MMNVLFPIRFRFTRKGGVAFFNLLLFKYISKHLNIIDLSFKNDEYKYYGINNNYPFYYLIRLLVVIKDYILFKYKIDKNKISIAHINMSLTRFSIKRHFSFLKILSKKDIPFIVFFHGWNKKYEYDLTKQKIFVKDFILYCNKAKKIFVLAEEFNHVLTKWGIKQDLISVTKTFIDDEVFNVVKNKNIQKKINILFMSRIEKAKGIYEAIDAYKQLKDDNFNIYFRIAGTGSELISVKKYVEINQIKDIEFLGWVEGEHKYSILNESDVFLFPTHHEGMPISLIEAMAFGLAIVTRNVGGIKDFFINDKMGYVTDSNDPKVFKELLCCIINNSEHLKNISDFNKEYSFKNFKASVFAENLINIYKELLLDKC